jgi:hypothetical protein
VPEKNLEFGKYGARGIKGSDAVARQLDNLHRLHRHPRHHPTRPHGPPQLPDKIPADPPAARDQGLTVTDRTLAAWLDGKRRPSKANLDRIDAVYRTVRRHNVARHLLSRLNRDGGTRVEIHPFNQSQVARPYQRVVEFRKMNVRRWDRIVAAWANDDLQTLDDVWTTDVLPDLGSQWGQYEYVSNIGFAA